MVGDDTTDAPPYYLVFDDVRVNDRASFYEQLYIGDADAVARDNGDGSFVFGKKYYGPWLSPVNGAKGEASLDFNIEKAGNYQVWIYMKKNPESERTGAFAFRIGESDFNGSIAFRSRCANCWQWAASGNAMALSVGRQTLRIFPRDTIFAKVALIPEEKAKDYKGWADLPEGALVRSCTEAVVTGDAWTKKTANRSPAELLVASLNLEPAAFAADSFSFNTRFYGQQFITLPRAKLFKRQPAANFLTLLYPYLPEMEKPKILREKDGAVITWKNAADTIRITDTEIVVQRKHQDGKEEVFRYKRPAS